MTVFILFCFTCSTWSQLNYFKNLKVIQYIVLLYTLCVPRRSHLLSVQVKQVKNAALISNNDSYDYVARYPTAHKDGFDCLCGDF